MTVSEQYKLEQEVKLYKEKAEKLDLFNFHKEHLNVLHALWDDEKKLEKIQELSKVYQREEWGDCRYIRKKICGELNTILNSQEKE